MERKITDQRESNQQSKSSHTNIISNINEENHHNQDNG